MAFSMSSDHLKYVDLVANNDVKIVTFRDGPTRYNGSWKKRGGVGIAMNLFRKIDRIDNSIQPSWNIIEHLVMDMSPDGLIDDVRDLRQYLLMLEALMIANGIFHPHRDDVRDIATPVVSDPK